MEYYSKNSFVNLAILLLLLIGALYICTWSPSNSNPFLPFQNTYNCPHLKYKTIKFPIDELELALEKASMPNKTVIIAVVNKAYVEQTVDTETTMLDLFLESFWLGEGTRPLLDHLLLVAVDQTAYDRCKFKGLHCYRLVTDGVDFAGEKTYMSDEFIKMMWRRTLFLLDVLKHGYNFIFTDTDVMWLRNPFPRLKKHERVDLQISVDVYFGSRSAKFINTGFYYVRSNNKTISLFNKWYAMKDNSTGKKEQDVLADLMKQGMSTQLGLSVWFLETKYFSGFCQDSEDIRAVTTVHANCCRYIRAKVTDLTAVLRDWKKFKVSTVNNPITTYNGTMNFQWSGHFGCWNAWNTSA